MKILHINVVGFYTVGMTYQENILTEEHAKQGHEVILWTSCYEYKDGKEQKLKPSDEVLENGVRLVRLPYVSFGIPRVTDRIRKIRGIVPMLEELQPELIMQHDFATAITPDVCSYVQKHPEVRYLVDCHSDPLNSARNFFSRFFLHTLIYKRYAWQAYRTAEKLFYISLDTLRFLKDVYHLPEEKLAHLPLGSTIPSEEEYKHDREQLRAEIDASPDTIVFVHSGKLAPEKKTRDILDAMKGISATDIRLVVIGSADAELTRRLNEAADQDPRIRYLGWKSGGELMAWLCAGDVYVLPGDQSATVQCAMCRKEAILVYPYENYQTLMHETGAFVRSVDELRREMESMIGNREKLAMMRNNAYQYASKYLDYREQAKYLTGGELS